MYNFCRKKHVVPQPAKNKLKAGKHMESNPAGAGNIESSGLASKESPAGAKKTFFYN